ncbi:MAG: alpha-L-rhamnosidase N-terminal domain-containing protein [Thermoflavifilum sp.]|uniref:alpha-L-rhamnosidase-related protein n=1 Tax=Thermoflavifilum sp. TaxID=1968839 RepID=UPI0018A39C46|nr:family 78 glycoside hydrolase catalytic domain [Thermoflavifilum sp.]QOR75720.1 MAG: alpha-L-rhamnosidase N-terminal domain-containing protein [Thermoflavifilum sp.]
MLKKHFIGIIAIATVFNTQVIAQPSVFHPRLLHEYWPAHWICCPGVPASAYGVFHFRKTFQLDAMPAQLVIHVTADNRYHLFVNGHDVGRGPARGDTYNWNVETYDIAPYLQKGKNVLAAMVWNMGEYAPMAQISARTGFLVQADDPAWDVLNTNRNWKVLHDTAYQPCARETAARLHTYFVTGPGDAVHAANFPWGWEQTDYDDGSWLQAEDVPAAAVPAGVGSDNVWTLVPSPIPQMEYSPQRLQAIRLSSSPSGAFPVRDTFIQPHHPLTIPAHQQVRMILDQGQETVAYPVLVVNGGAGSNIRITYAEAAVDSNGRKGNRNEIKGKHILGLYDEFYPDGGNQRRFSPLWIRAYRYIQLDITTADDPLTVDDFYGIYTGYPFHRLASFASNDSSLQSIWNVGWHTARLCAGETYFDCPYYEQLQYEGDTRIQALISLYNTGDDRLMRKAIHDFYDSRTPNGLTQGRFPSHRLQIIPPYSLFWISMLHDYWMLRPDTDFVKSYLSGIQPILSWYEAHVDPAYNMLGPMDWWSFVDWAGTFPGGSPAGATDGHSAILTCQLIYTLHQAADLFEAFGYTDQAAHYSQLAFRLAQGVFTHCFDMQRMEMANTPEKQQFSQHASILAVLADVIPAQWQRQVMQNVLTDTSLDQVTFYFRFYLTQAMVKVGLGDAYVNQLNPWFDMLKIGLTTFAEKPEPTRSDCHAWSASPAYDFLATICGIRPAAPGFARVAITPHLGHLNHVVASMPHPRGMIRVEFFQDKKGKLTGEVSLPEHVDGYIEWRGSRIALQGGSQAIMLP